MERRLLTMLELDFDDSVARGLHRYVRLVTSSVGLRGDCSYVQVDEVAHAYVALDGSLPSFPDDDVALLWDEANGWAAAVEQRSDREPRVVARFPGDVLPTPEAVAVWVRRLFQQHHTVESTEPRPRTDDVRARLVAYADPTAEPRHHLVRTWQR
jgi:hypothetical protein